MRTQEYYIPRSVLNEEVIEKREEAESLLEILENGLTEMLAEDAEVENFPPDDDNPTREVYPTPFWQLHHNSYKTEGLPEIRTYVSLKNNALFVLANNQQGKIKEVTQKINTSINDILTPLIGKKLLFKIPKRKTIYTEWENGIPGDLITDEVIPTISNKGTMGRTLTTQLSDQTSSSKQYYPSAILKCTTPLNRIFNEEFQMLVDKKRGKATDTRGKNLSLEEVLLFTDSLRIDSPALEKSCLIDNTKGHWDLYWPSDVPPNENLYHKVELPEEWHGRDPEGDIQQGVPIAIDFGTTSTVVAFREDGYDHLLRIGVQDYQHAVKAEHYENPTALEFIDYNNLEKCWNELPYKPFIRWVDVKCSHQARAEILGGETPLAAVRSGMTNIKTWARNGPSSPPLQLTDQKGMEFEISTLPVDADSNLQDDFSSYPFDPIELYAFFLGLGINNQLSYGGRIYHDYYLTFPIKFTRETRQRILNSFYRGLERSLPASLGFRKDWKEKTSFSVAEHANEPTAFAASVLPSLGLEASESGLAFGVFDFGGGTADFCFGLYRNATPKEEEEEGWETVLDILDSAGDENLGGEHLLHGLAYNVVSENKGALQDNGNGCIPFVKPVEARPFPGSEMLLDDSVIAHTNTTRLREALRPIWECGEFDEDAGLTLTLTNNTGEEVPMVALNIDVETLNDFLKQRIFRGVGDFFATFQQAFKASNATTHELHVLLAGNSCKSPLVREAFDEYSQKILTSENCKDTIHIHELLLPSDETPEAPTIKTGVALGLLRTIPGEPVGIVERKSTENETPFRFAVGRFKQNILKPLIQRNSPYGTAYKLGVVPRSGVLTIGYSLSSRAIEEQIKRGDSECSERRISWNKADAGKTIMVQATSPKVIEFYLEENNDIRQVVELKG